MLILVLPLQGVAGVSMSMCASSMGMSNISSTMQPGNPSSEGASCHHADSTAMPALSFDVPDTSSVPGDCPHCFAFSHFLTALSILFLRDASPAQHAVFHAANFFSLSLTPPLRPPLFA